jgi:hypothetical protein
MNGTPVLFLAADTDIAGPATVNDRLSGTAGYALASQSPDQHHNGENDEHDDQDADHG